MTLPRPRHAEDRAEAATQRAPAPGSPASAPGLQLPGPGHGEAGDRGDGGGRARHHAGQDCGGSTQVELQTKVREDFTITERAPTSPLALSHLRRYAKQAPKQVGASSVIVTSSRTLV